MGKKNRRKVSIESSLSYRFFTKLFSLKVGLPLLCIVCVVSGGFIYVGTLPPPTFSIIQITDTEFLSSTYPNLYSGLTNWIVDNAKSLHSEMVIHTGDIVHDPWNTTQLANADASMVPLVGRVPYIWLAGNHDLINDEGDGNASTYGYIGVNYNSFSPALISSEPYFVSNIFEGTSNAVKFSFQGYNFMVIAIAFDANSTVLDWAKNLIDSNPKTNVIVATHNFLNGEGGYGLPNSTFEVAWANNFETWLNQFPNVFLTLNGHCIGDGFSAWKQVNCRTETFFNMQQEDNKTGSVFARVYSFNMANPAHPTVNAYTVSSASLPQWKQSVGERIVSKNAPLQFCFQTNLIRR